MVRDLRNSKTAREANSAATWSCPDSSKPVTKGRNNIIKMDNHERSQSWTRRFTNFQTRLYWGFYVRCVNTYQISLKYDKNTTQFTRRATYIYGYFASWHYHAYDYQSWVSNVANDFRITTLTKVTRLLHCYRGYLSYQVYVVSSCSDYANSVFHSTDIRVRRSAQWLLLPNKKPTWSIKITNASPSLFSLLNKLH